MADPLTPPCVLCAKRPAAAEHYQTCPHCAAGMDADLAAMPTLTALLPAAVAPSLAQPTGARLRTTQAPLPGGDALALTARTNPGVRLRYVPHVRIVPRDVEVEVAGKPVAVTLRERLPVLDGDGRPVLVPDGDQDGVLSPWLMVAYWTAHWAKLRDVGEVGAGGVHWLRERLDWACRDHPDLATFADQLRECVGRMRAILATGPTTVRYGNRCPKCGNAGTLWRQIDRTLGADDRRMAYVNCSACPALFEVDDERVVGGRRAA